MMKKSSQIKILLLGDIMLGRSFNHVILDTSLKYPWGNCLPVMKSADIVVGNLETSITDSNKKWPNKTFNYKMDTKLAKTLSLANISYLSLANNHILDYMEEGMHDTINTLNRLNIKHAGAARLAQQPTFIKIKDKTIGFLSAADHPSEWKNNMWYIPIHKANVSAKKDLKSVLQIVVSTKKKCDFLIFSLHWNYNYVDKIEQPFIDFAHQLVDAGVDVIHGHSPHHLLKIEKYKDAYIFYSLGDFIDDYAVSSKYRNDLAVMVQLSIDENKFSLGKIYPTKISNHQVNITQNPKDIDFILNSLSF